MSHALRSPSATGTQPLPTGVTLETLLDVVAGWQMAGGDQAPRQADAVAQVTGHFGNVDPQTPFLESLGVLVPDGTGHRLTAMGSDLAGALASGDPEWARNVARDALVEDEVARDVLGLLRENPLAPERLVPLVATLTGRTPGSESDHADVTTFLHVLEWVGLLSHDRNGRAVVANASGAPRLQTDPDADPKQQTPPDAPAAENPTPPAGQDAASTPDAATSVDSTGAGNDDSHALLLEVGADSLEVRVDGDPEQLEGIVRALRHGLLPEDP